jgi:hypothetical protein
MRCRVVEVARGNHQRCRAVGTKMAVIRPFQQCMPTACFLSEREADLNAEFGRTGHGS